MNYLRILFILPIFTFAQEKFKVEYEVRNFISVTNTTPEKAKKLEEAFSKPKYFELLVEENQCLSKEIHRIDNSQTNSMKMVYVDGDVRDIETFLNFESNKKLIIKYVDGKLYLVSDDIKKDDWIITKETKVINGYTSYKATLIKEPYSIEAWFTKDIKTKCGPNGYFNLPGLIVEVKSVFTENPSTYSTVKLETIKLEPKLSIKEPLKGIKMTSVEFKEFITEYYRKIDEKYKEMQSQGVDIK